MAKFECRIARITPISTRRAATGRERGDNVSRLVRQGIGDLTYIGAPLPSGRGSAGANSRNSWLVFQPVLLCLLLGFSSASFAQNKPSEELEKYLKKWVNEDVVYIITPEERETFLKLHTPEEKENFIEQFWLRRDPDPSTKVNEFKEEHFRRIAYANDHFYSGVPGWRTDRGRIYIRFGQPDSVQRFGPGETYVRPMSEGGGITKTFPFEIWRYRDIEGVGPDIEIEFVDTSLSNEYHLTIDPQEKDMLFYVGGGKTEYEQLGMESRWLRNTRRGLATNYPGPTKDLPFEKLALLGKIDRPQPIRFENLRTMVSAHVTYQQLPIRVRPDYIRLDNNSAVALLNVELDDRIAPTSVAIGTQQPASQQSSNRQTREIQIYGRIQDVSGRSLQEFDASVKPGEESGGLLLYQKALTLPPGVYKLNLVVRDSRDERVAIREERIEIPRAPAALSLSPLILAEEIAPAQGGADSPRPFELGDLRVVPRLDTYFRSKEIMKVYFQAYNFQTDDKTQQPSLAVTYYVLKDGKQIKRFSDFSGASMQAASPKRAVFASGINLKLLEPGSYRLVVRIKDKLSGKEAGSSVEFSVG
ncbi:MAG TPA: GWxTD domain-containing protein [Acidobacteriota bacterium]|jgi:GWxTD domain-containing protein|nr:GWxTD domain-containing protein [Acidobacteriota bacterium]